MDAEQQPTKPCTKLGELPLVATDWQLTTWYPDCEHYCCGTCANPERTDSDAACPFNGKPLPLREVELGANRDQWQKPPEVALHDERENQRLSAALEQAIRSRIASRTGSRLQSLEVELMRSQVVIGAGLLATTSSSWRCTKSLKSSGPLMRPKWNSFSRWKCALLQPSLGSCKRRSRSAALAEVRSADPEV